MSGQNECCNLVVVEGRFIHLDYCNNCEKCRFIDSQQIEDFYLDDISIDMDDINVGMDIDISVELDIENDVTNDNMDMDDFNFGDIFNLTIDDYDGSD
jgi:hypothetical protein